MRRSFSRVLSRGAALLAVLALGACADRVSGPGPDDGNFAKMRITANVSNTPIATLVVTVTAPDISTPLVYNLEAQNGVASGTIKMPPGANRTINVKAYSQAGAVTHEGSVLLSSVSPGQNPPVTISLTSNAGHVPVTVTIGATSVLVSPAADTLAPGDSLQLAATLVTAGGDTVTGTVEWATANPARATVTSTGLVIALDTGTVQIFAVHEGVGGSALLTIRSDTTPPPPPPPDSGSFVWTGAVSTDWSNPANWSGNAVPTSADSALVPAGPVNMPLLTASADVGTLVVEAGATVDVAGFTLTAFGSVLADGPITGTSGRVTMTGLATSLRGTLPRLFVTGTTSLVGNTLARFIDVNGGRISDSSFRLAVDN